MTSTVIAFTGLIGFVGLAAPHMGRLIVGNDYRKLIPAPQYLAFANAFCRHLEE